MKTFFAFLLMISRTSFALASELWLQGPCDQKAELIASSPLKEKISLGAWSVQILNSNKIPFQGSASGFSQIKNSPVGDEALEIISDSMMRAYGWCYSLDGIFPDVLSDSIDLEPNISHKVQWFYASALYDKGEWKEYCRPSYETHPSCQK